MEREKLVSKLINQAFHWVIGGYENEIQDGNLDQMPNRKELENEVYWEVIEADGLEVGYSIIPTKKDIRFLGKAKIMEMIQKRFDKSDIK